MPKLYPSRIETDENGETVTVIQVPYMGLPKLRAMLDAFTEHQGEGPLRCEFTGDWPLEDRDVKGGKHD